MVDCFQKAIFKAEPQIEADSPGFSKMGHGPDPQIKAFSAKMFEVQGWHNHWNG